MRVGQLAPCLEPYRHEILWLLEQYAQDWQAAVCAVAFYHNVEPLFAWAESAGFRTDETDELKRKRRLQEQAGRRRNKAHIRELMAKLPEFYETAQPSWKKRGDVMSLKELLLKDSEDVAHDRDKSGKCRDRLFTYHTRVAPDAGRRMPDPEEIARRLSERLGAQGAKAALMAVGVPEAFARGVVSAVGVADGQGVDRGEEESGDAGFGARGLEGRGRDGDGDSARGEVGDGAVGGVDRGERSARGYERRVTRLELSGGAGDGQ